MITNIGDAYTFVWSETGRQGCRIRIRMTDDNFRVTRDLGPITMQRQHTVLAASTISSGGFAIAWNEGHLVKVRYYCGLGNPLKTRVIQEAAKQVDKLELVHLTNGELAVGCREFLVILDGERKILAAVGTEPWYSEMAEIGNGKLARIVMTNRPERFHGGPPIYWLTTSIFESKGKQLNETHLDVPATIVGDTYSHPDHLKMSKLSDGRFILVWTQLGHHLGNSIKAQIFASDGVRSGDTFTITEAEPGTSVNQPSIVELADGFLIAWTLHADPNQFHISQLFDLAGAKVGNHVRLDADQSEARYPISLHRSHLDEPVAMWCEGEAILARQLPTQSSIFRQ